MKFLDDVGKRNVGQGKAVMDVFSPFHRQPLVGRHAELFLERPAEGVQPVAAHLGQRVGVFRLAVVCQHEAFERHFLVRHGMEEQAQFFGCVVFCKKPYQFLVFQSPEGWLVSGVVYVAVHPVHQVGELPAGGQLAVIIRLPVLRNGMFVGEQEGEDAILYVACHVVEAVYQQCRVAQSHPVVVAAAWNEQDFSGAEVFFLEDIARQPDITALTE